MNKKGQIFIIAAIVIVGIVMGLGAIAVTTKFTQEDTTASQIKEELNYEGNKVIDAGFFSGQQGQISDRIQNLSEYYLTSQDTQILLLYSDPNSLGGYNATIRTPRRTGSTNVGSASTSHYDRTTINANTQQTVVDDRTFLTVDYSGLSYQFDITDRGEGSVFYLVVQQKKGEEIYSSSNAQKPRL